MKEAEFHHLFPHADISRFLVDEGDVLYHEQNGDNDDVDFPAFWSYPDKVKSLNLDDFNIYLQDKLGYLPYRRRKYHFRVQGVSTAPEHWKPRKVEHIQQPSRPKETPKSSQGFPLEWSVNMSNKTPSIITENSRGNIDLESFRIYVSPNEYFVMTHKFPFDLNSIGKIDFSDNSNVYTAIMKGIYILSYLGGIGEKNLTSENPLAQSLAHFYFHYWLLKFYNYRDLLDKYNTSVVEKHPWSELKWTKHFIRIPEGEYNYSAWGIRHKWYHDKGHIRNISYKGRVTHFEHSEGRRDLKDDFYKVLLKETRGLTRIGLLLFQESCEAYVRSVLGAQADTRWKIIGDGARSYQTQDRFLTHVQNITKMSDTSQLISEMRLAIQATKVRLDFCINPKVLLLPSHMVYIKDTPGYNNTLLQANSSMTFGVNNGVNTSLLFTPKKRQAKLQKTTPNTLEETLRNTPKKPERHEDERSEPEEPPKDAKRVTNFVSSGLFAMSFLSLLFYFL